MKLLRTIIVIVLSMLLTFQVFSQNQNNEPVLPKVPSNWGFERYAFPIDFAPSIHYTGFEEIRFSPGMMDTSSAFYFTYIFVVALNDSINLNEVSIADFLNRYYRGLSAEVAKGKKFNPDTIQMNAQVTELKNNNHTLKLFDAEIPFFDTFSNGQKIQLTMEISTSFSKAKNRTYMTVLVSAAEKSKTEVWNKLREIQQSNTFD